MTEHSIPPRTNPWTGRPMGTEEQVSATYWHLMGLLASTHIAPTGRAA